MRSLRSGRRRDGRLVIAPETYRRLTDCPSRRCNGIVTTNSAPPDACKAHGGGPYVSDSLLLCGFPDRSPTGHDALQAGLNPGMQLFGQRRIAQLRGFRLTVALRPPDEVDQCACLGGVAIGLMHQ